MGIPVAGSRNHGTSAPGEWVIPLVILVLLVSAVAGVAFMNSLPVPAFLVALSTWLHTLATVVWIGYFLFTGLIYLPVLERQMEADALRATLEQVSTHLRPFFGGSLLIFLVTGTHLMLINPGYRGFGDFFANPWSVLIVIKHVLVPAFLAMAVFSEWVLLRRVSDQNPRALRWFRWTLNANLVLGAAILLLTSVAQAG